MLFYLRDRNQKGERDLFRKIIVEMNDDELMILKRNLSQIPVYGRWDDIIFLIQSGILKEECLDMIKKQILTDTQSENPSLLAKWLPTQNKYFAAQLF